MEHILLSPPIAFLIFLVISFGLSAFSKRLAARSADSTYKGNAYACGEDVPENRAQPNYNEFFKFAFFFTIIHVIVLVVATDPGGLSVTSGVYIGVTVLSLFMLLRK